MVANPLPGARFAESGTTCFIINQWYLRQWSTCNILLEDAVSCSTDAWTADSFSTTSGDGEDGLLAADRLPCCPPSFVDVAAALVRRDFTDWRMARRSAIIVSTCPAIDCRLVCAFDSISFSRVLAICRSPPDSSAHNTRNRTYSPVVGGLA